MLLFLFYNSAMPSKMKEESHINELKQVVGAATAAYCLFSEQCQSGGQAFMIAEYEKLVEIKARITKNPDFNKQMVISVGFDRLSKLVKAEEDLAKIQFKTDVE